VLGKYDNEEHFTSTVT